MAEKSLELLEDWEEWNPSSGTSFLVHAAAGSVAGAAEHCAMFPFDTVKTHFQAANNKSPRVVFTEIKRIVKSSKLRLWRGVSTMFTACVPAHAAYFSVFEQSKLVFGNELAIANATSGILATICHDFIMTPMDVIKQRLQLGFHSGPIDCFQTILRTEGFRALYLSFPTTLFMNIPYAGVMVSINEGMKKILNPRNEYNVPAFVASGAVAGGIAAAVTNPLDVVKTRLQTQNLLNSFPNCENLVDQKNISKELYPTRGFNVKSHIHNHINLGIGVRYTYTLPPTRHPANFNLNTSRLPTASKGKLSVSELECLCKEIPIENSHRSQIIKSEAVKYHGFIQCLKTIYKEEGLRGFSRGLSSRLVVHIPSVAISWTAYESTKAFLQSSI